MNGQSDGCPKKPGVRRLLNGQASMNPKGTIPHGQDNFNAGQQNLGSGF